MCDKIRVAVRIRPSIKQEIEKDLPEIWHVNNNANTIKLDDPDDHRTGEEHTFDHVFGKSATNANIYDSLVAPMVELYLEGYNCSIFAYGQTSSGKTYTINGCANDAGIIARVADSLFKRVNIKQDHKFLFRVSYVEIYNEKIYDLLTTSNVKVKTREDCDGNILLNAKEIITATTEEIMQVVAIGKRNREVHSTNMNIKSNESHIVLRITMECIYIYDLEKRVKLCHFDLIDLVGLGRLTQAQTSGIDFKERTFINRSLTALGVVIQQLADNRPHIGYGNAKLTFVLRNSLGGNAQTLFIINMTPVPSEDSHLSLEFANRAKTIKNKPRINTVSGETSLIAKCQKRIDNLEIKRLKVLNQNRDIQTDVQDKYVEVLETRIKIINEAFTLPKSPTSNRRHTSNYDRRVILKYVSNNDLLDRSQYPPIDPVISEIFSDTEDIHLPFQTDVDVDLSVIEEDEGLEQPQGVDLHEEDQIDVDVVIDADVVEQASQIDAIEVKDVFIQCNLENEDDVLQRPHLENNEEEIHEEIREKEHEEICEEEHEEIREEEHEEIREEEHEEIREEEHEEIREEEHEEIREEEHEEIREEEHEEIREEEIHEEEGLYDPAAGDFLVPIQEDNHVENAGADDNVGVWAVDLNYLRQGVHRLVQRNRVLVTTICQFEQENGIRRVEEYAGIVRGISYQVSEQAAKKFYRVRSCENLTTNSVEEIPQLRRHKSLNDIIDQEVECSINEWISKCNELQTELDAVVTERHTLIETVTETSEENSRIAANFRKLNEKYKSEHEKHKNENKVLNNQLKEYKEKSHELEEQLRTQKVEMQTLATKNEQLKKELLNSRKRYATKSPERAQDLHDLVVLQKQVVEYKKIMTEMETQLSANSKEIVILKRKLGEGPIKQSEIEKLQDKLKLSQLETNNFKAKGDQLKRELDELQKKFEHKIDPEIEMSNTLKQETERFLKELSSLKKDVNTRQMSQIVTSQGELIITLQSTIDKMGEQLKLKSIEKDGISVEFEKLKRKFQNMKLEQRDKGENFEKTEQELWEHRQELKLTRESLNKLQGDYVKLKTKCECTSSSLSSPQRRLKKSIMQDSSQKIQESDEGQEDSVEEDPIDYKKKADALAVELADVKEKYNKLFEEDNLIQNRFTTLTAKYDKLALIIHSLRAQITHLEKELEKYTGSTSSSPKKNN